MGMNTSLILALRQEDCHDFIVTIGYILKLCTKNQKQRVGEMAQRLREHLLFLKKIQVCFQHHTLAHNYLQTQFQRIRHLFLTSSDTACSWCIDIQAGKTQVHMKLTQTKLLLLKGLGSMWPTPILTLVSSSNSLCVTLFPSGAQVSFLLLPFLLT